MEIIIIVFIYISEIYLNTEGNINNKNNVSKYETKLKEK